MPTTVQEVGGCDAAAAETIDTFDAIFNGIEADEAAITDHVRAVVELSREFDELIASDCGPTDKRDALAELAEWMKDQARTRNASVSTLIAGFLADIEQISAD